MASLAFVIIIFICFSVSGALEPTNVLENAKKDRNLKIQLLVSKSNEEKTTGERVGKDNDYCGDEGDDLNIAKTNFPVNTLLYANQGLLPTVKGDSVIYLDYFVLRQIVPALNAPDNIDTYVYAPDEVKLFVPMYDLANGDFLDLKTTLAYIIIRGDEERFFFTNGFNKNKSKNFY